jgi:hypothetical protein
MKKTVQPRQGKKSQPPTEENPAELRTEFPISEKDEEKEAEDKMRIRQRKKQ